VDGDARSAVEAASVGVDLLVVGSNRTRTRGGIVPGTFSVKVAEGAHCPVVVVPREWAPADGPVVVGVQTDDTDETTLLFAIHEARVLHQPLRVVHAWAMPKIIPLGPDTAKAAGLHETALVTLTARLRAENPDLRVEAELVEGDAAAALLDEGTRAGLLVLGSHGRTTFDRFFLGSISREVLLHPPCPVAVVRPHTTKRS
jgi:nucleotide-binding universal stress UspA family protein